jgi:hypothetical protein
MDITWNELSRLEDEMSIVKAERDMQALDTALGIDDDGLDAHGQQLYREHKQSEPFVCCGCPGGWCEGCVPEIFEEGVS